MTVKKAKSSSSRFILPALLTVYSVCMLSSNHYERLTGDATLYLSIAEKYVNGDFSNAINGYWGPLLSWLLVPFLAFGVPHVVAINALNLLFGLLTITGVWKLSYRFEISKRIRIVTMLPVVPILLFVSLVQPMDFLLLCVLVYYLYIVFDEDYPEKAAHAAAAGFFGALAYFSKPFGFPFFISHFLLINACHYLRKSTKEHRKKVMTSVIAGFVTFFLLSGIWIGLISEKYGRFTFSNMGRGVVASLGPGSEHTTLEKGSPIFSEGFYAPPNDTAIVIYEDPSAAKNTLWNPMDSRSSLKHFVSNLKENVFECLRILEFFSRLSTAILIAYILLIFVEPLKKLYMRTDILYPFLTVVLFAGGYFPFHYETRYLWIVNILLLLMGAKVLNELCQSNFIKNTSMKNIVTGFFLLSFTVSPVKATVDAGRDNINRNMYTLGTQLRNQYEIQGNIASNRKKMEITVHDSWHNTFRLAYWLKSRYYGQARGNISDEDLENELKTNNIDYYFFWGDGGSAPPFLSRYRELTGEEYPGLHIYSLHEE